MGRPIILLDFLPVVKDKFRFVWRVNNVSRPPFLDILRMMDMQMIENQEDLAIRDLDQLFHECDQNLTVHLLLVNREG